MAENMSEARYQQIRAKVMENRQARRLAEALVESRTPSATETFESVDALMERLQREDK